MMLDNVFAVWSPADRVAGRVLGSGEHYDRIVRDPRHVHLKSPPELRTTGLQLKDRALIGATVGRFTVIGILKEHGRKGRARWVVRCQCGDYEFRSAKAITNPENGGDRCMDCRQVDYLRMHSQEHDRRRR